MRKRTCTSKYEMTSYLRRAGLVFVLICLMGSGAFALDPMGPPTASLRLDELMIGIDYTSSSMDLNLNSGQWSEYYNGSLYDAGEAVSFELQDFEMNKIYANLGYGLFDNCDIYLRLGTVSTEFGDSIWEAGEKYESNTNFSFCIGSKATFYEADNFKLGRLIQISWANMDGDLKAPDWAEADSVELDLMEIQIAVGPTFTSPSGGVSIYGGPFFHYVDGDIEDKFTLASGIDSEYSWDIDETSTFGGYIGTQLYFSENSYINIEYQHTSGAKAIGVSYTLEF